MNFYIKTSLSPKIITPLLKYYLRMYSQNTSRSLRNSPLSDFIKTDYKLTIEEILDAYIRNIVITKISNDILKITNKKIVRIKGHSLDEMVGVLENGNTEVRAPRIISELLKTSLNRVDYILDGA